MKKLFVVSLCLAFLAACSPEHQASQNHGTAHTDTEHMDGMVISAPMVRAPLGGQSVTAGYFKISNHTDMDDALISVESASIPRVEMHITEDNNGIMSMRRAETIQIPQGQTLAFKPGGYHLMLFDVSAELLGEDVQLTLKFQNAPELSIIAEVVETVPLSEDHSGHR